MNLLESMTNTVSVVYVRLGFTLGLIASFPGPFQTGLGTRLELSGCSFVSSPAQVLRCLQYSDFIELQETES